MKFSILWTVFEVWTKENCGMPAGVRTRDALDWFKQNDNDLKDVASEFWQTSTERTGIASVASRLNINIPDTDNPGDIIEAVYTARNNLIHGTWQPVTEAKASDERDMMYVSASLLHKWLVVARRNKVL